MLQDIYMSHAVKYQPHCWFYATSHEVVKNEINVPDTSSIFVYKDNETIFFEGLNVSLIKTSL